MSQDFTKVVRIGKADVGVGRPVHVFCKLRFADGKLSISGVEGPKSNGDAWGSCGQIDMHLKPEHFVEFAPRWGAETVARFLEVWGAWHLNDMTAGSPAQMAHLKANPIVPDEYAYPTSHYDVAKERLEAAGLQPDPSYLHNGKPYSYGSAWLRVEVPEEAVAFLRALPETDVTPAWV